MSMFNPMTFTDAVAIIKDMPDLWARPISWRGFTSAYRVKDNVLLFVLNSGGGLSGMMPFVDVLLSDWEVVEPSDVL